MSNSNQIVELSLEKKFSIRSFRDQVENMSHLQAQEFLIKLYEQMLVQEATYQSMLKKQWGLADGPQFK